MKTKNNKFSGDYGTQSLNNRLTRIEKLLERILEPITDGGNNNNSLTLPKLANDLARSKSNVFGKIKINGLQQADSFTIKPSGNQSQVGNKNNLMLSYGQIIAELASAITRFGRRNS